MPNIGPVELAIVVIIALIVVGPGKLPEVGSALGRSIREFRKAASDVKDSTRLDPLPETNGSASAAPAPAAPAAPVTTPAEAPAAQTPAPAADDATQTVAPAPDSTTDAPAR